MNDPILMYGDEPIGQLYKNSKAQSTSIARVVTNPLTGDGISQGSGFMLDGKRCVALINIATGTTMVEHTHYEYESVEEKIVEVDTSVDLLNRMIKRGLLSASKPLKIPMRGYSSCLIYGMFQGVGTYFLCIQRSGASGTLSVTNVVTGQTFSHSALTFTFENTDQGYVVISTTQSASSVLVYLAETNI